MFHRDQQVKFNEVTYIYVGPYIGMEPRNRTARSRVLQVALGRQFQSLQILGEVTDTLDIVHLPGHPNKQFLVSRSQLKKIHTHNKQDDMIRRAKRRRGLDVMPNGWQHRPIPTPVMEITEPQETNNVQEE